MNDKAPRNIAVSVRQRLLNKAREERRPFNEVLQYFVMERFLYRLSKSTHARKFILKGALMSNVWDAPVSRPTMDIDLLGYTSNRIDAVTKVISEICLQDVEPDGITFSPATVKGERIIEGADYEGVRLRLQARLGAARITVQVDIGFGDIVVPSPKLVHYPTILHFPAPQLYGYSRESSVAEKFEAMVTLGELNSRMKDFFDILLLARQFDFEGRILSRAIAKTFETRETQIPPYPVAFARAFSEDTSKSTQWRAFLRRNKLVGIPENFTDVVTIIASFLGPVVEALSAGRSFVGKWSAPGPWDNK